MPTKKSKKIKKTNSKQSVRRQDFPKITMGNYSKHILYEDGTVQFEIDYEAAKLYVDKILKEYRLNKNTQKT